MWDLLVKQWEQEKEVLKQSPLVFCLTLILAVCISFLGVNWFYSERIEGYAEDAIRQENRITDLTNQLTSYQELFPGKTAEDIANKQHELEEQINELKNSVTKFTLSNPQIDVIVSELLIKPEKFDVLPGVHIECHVSDSFCKRLNMAFFMANWDVIDQNKSWEEGFVVQKQGSDRMIDSFEITDGVNIYTHSSTSKELTDQITAAFKVLNIDTQSHFADSLLGHNHFMISISPESGGKKYNDIETSAGKNQP